jgi:hypothetical protein
MILGVMSPGAIDPEKLVAMLALVGMICLAIWAGVKWLLSKPLQPDPWDLTVVEQLETDDTTPMCHRCLLPHHESLDFCPNCGAPVGQYTNWLPFPYLFSIGHTLRIGTSGEFRRTPLTVAGFILFGLAEYTLFVPIYWIVFMRKLLLGHQSDIQSDQSPPAATSSEQ